MQEELKDLIYSMVQGNAAESQEMMNQIMSQKVGAALDDLRVNVAQSMFKEPEQE
jgi:hypothetical protein